MRELYCEIGDHNWIWPHSRGRVAKSCPEHRDESKKQGAKRWREENKEYKRSKDAEYRANHLGEAKAYQVEYYQNNKSELQEKRRDYQNEWRRQRRKTHPESFREAERRKKARRKNAPVFEPALIDQYVKVLEFDPCSYCEGPMEQPDHIVPLIPDGEHRWENLTASCAFCNNSKSNTPLLEWLIKRRN